MSNRLAVLPQYLIPKRALTRFSRWVADRERGAVTQWIIRRFIAKYGVNMNEAAASDIAVYKTFNEFFTRALKDGARPLANADWLCPVDGAISQFGVIEDDQIFQAKGHAYSTRALLGGDAALAAQFAHGSFATLYLSPKDYHRVHMPCDGRLLSMIYVPGALFSVNPQTARSVPGLFARNERVVCLFETAHGPLALVLVGAAIVSSMQTAWHGVVNPKRGVPIRSWDYDGQDLRLQRGAEMGRFLLGSTVVLLFAPPRVTFDPAWAPERAVQFGQAMAQSADGAAA
ncbi:MAG: archaetidylserine decarboxylase [Variovorax sp.]